MKLLHELKEPISLIKLIERGLTKEEKELYCLGVNKQRRTKAMFYDFNKDDPTVYTLQDCRPLHYQIGINGLLVYDMRQLYLGVDDITEFRFIDRFLYDKHQWEKMYESFSIKPDIDVWRSE